MGRTELSEFTAFEVGVVASLVGQHLSEAVLASVLEGAVLVSFEATGEGYFLTVAHPLLPVERTVCNTPLLVGRTDDLECGFVVFMENRELTLECHGWGHSLPEDFRTRDVQVEVAK